MIKVEENYATEFYYLSLLWRYDHLKVQPCYAFLCGGIIDNYPEDGGPGVVCPSCSFYVSNLLRY